MTNVRAKIEEEVEHTFEVFHSQRYILNHVPEGTAHDIKIQQYLRSESRIERRVRWTIQCGVTAHKGGGLLAEFEHTCKYQSNSSKKEKGPQKRLEDNDQISRNEFHSLREHQADPEASLIIKDRLTFCHRIR